MAKPIPFNPEVGPQDNNNFINSSRGVDANKAIGTLFSGLGDAFEQHVQAKDQETRQAILQESHTSTDSILRSSPQAPITVPQELQTQIASLGRIKNAYSQGVMGDTEFKMKIDTLAKKMRSRFGVGYTNEIDNALSNATGTSTANQVRQELIQNINALQSQTDKEQTKRDKWIDSNSKYLGDPNFRANYRALTGRDFEIGTDFNYAAAQAAVSGVKSYEHSIAARKAELELEAAGTKSSEDKAMQVASIEAAKVSKDIFNTGVNAGFKELQDATSASTNPKSPGGEKVTPEEENNIRIAFNKFRTDASLKVDGLLTDPEGPYVSRITSSKSRDDVKAIVLDRVSLYEKALMERDFGLLNQLAAQNAANTQYGTYSLMTDEKLGDFHTTYQALSKIYDPLMLQKILTQSPAGGGETAQQKMERVIGNSLVAALIKGDKSAGDLFSMAIQAGLDNPKLYRDSLARAITEGVLAPETTKEQASNMVKSLFEAPNQADFLRDYAVNDPMKLFTLMASPAMTEKLKGTEIWPKYSRWAYEQFSEAGRKAANTMIDTQVSSDRAAVTFDGKQFRLEVGALLPSPLDAGGTAIQTMRSGWEQMKVVAANQAVTDMNMYLNLVDPIATADGASVDQLIGVMFNGQAVQNYKKQGSLFTQMNMAIDTWLQGEAGLLDPESAPKVKGGSARPAGGPKNRDRAPRGVRNNNPLNIEYGKFTKGKGAVGSDGRFAQFSNSGEGVRAARDLLKSYNSRGLNTVNEIIGRWAPAGENDTNAYATSVAKALGVSGDQEIDVNDPSIAAKLITAMSRVENGADFYQPEDIEGWLQ